MQVFSLLCREAQLHSKNEVSSSHLHIKIESLLVKRSVSLSVKMLACAGKNGASNKRAPAVVERCLAGIVAFVAEKNFLMFVIFCEDVILP